MDSPYYLHETSIVMNIGQRTIIAPSAQIGDGTEIWHFSHIMENAVIGINCMIGSYVTIGHKVVIGNGCRIQDNAFLPEGVILEDAVFIGPSVVFTNVIFPRAFQAGQRKPTKVRTGCAIGANATIVCGIELGEYCMVGAGSVVTKDVMAMSVVAGNPARHRRFGKGKI